MTERDYIFIGVGLPLLWIVVSYLTAFSGWRQAHQWYPDRPSSSGASWSMQWGQIGMGHYRNSLTLTATPEGLRISVLFLWRIGHPPIFIPWADIVVARETWYSAPVVRLKLAKASDVPILVSEKTALAIANQAGAAWAGLKDSN